MSASRRDDCKTFFFVLRFRLFSSEPRPKTISETMARSTSLALILSAILGIANAQVAVLDGGNFDETVLNGGKNAIVKFYAPWYDRTRGSGFPIDRRGPAPCRKRTSPRLS